MSEIDDWTASARHVHAALIDDWNRKDAAALASRFAERGNLVGFDGSVVDGRLAIEAHLAPIFEKHATPLFVAKVREVRRLPGNALLLRAAAGMWPRDGGDLNPDLNAIQTMVLALSDGAYKIELFQNTPAMCEGKEALTAELRTLERPEVV